MEENTSMFNNKIVGVLVAVIVLATVLVPICNAFSDSGGDSPTPLASEVWENPGSPMSEIDLSDHSKTYTWSVDDGYPENATLLANIHYFDGNSPFRPSNDVFRYVDSKIKIEGSSSEEELSFGWVEAFGFWRYTLGSSHVFESVQEGDTILRYDTTGQNWIIEQELNSTGIHTDLSDIRFGGEHDLTIGLVSYGDESNPISANLDINVTNGSIEILRTIILVWGYSGPIEYEVVSPPEISIVNGELKLVGSIIGEYGGERVEIMANELTPSMFAGYIPKTVEIQSDDPTPGSDSGIAGTIIGLIPVFVAVALLGAIVTLFINKKD